MPFMVKTDGASEETIRIKEAEQKPLAHKTPHGDKLRELLVNSKLPAEDKPRVERQLDLYAKWVKAMSALQSTGDTKVADLVALLNEYKRSVELDLIWDSAGEFL